MTRERKEILRKGQSSYIVTNQWKQTADAMKGPFEVENVVGLNDYGIKIGDKVKLFHENMLKEYIEK